MEVLLKRRSFVSGAAALAAASAGPGVVSPAFATAIQPYSWDLNPPTDTRENFIAWGKTNVYKPGFVTTSVKLDRKTGSLNTTVDYGTAPSGSCSKRSTEQKF